MDLNIVLLSQEKLKSVKKLRQKKYRYDSNSYVCEGWRIFTEAVETNAKDIQKIIINESFKSGNHFSELIKIFQIKKIPIFSTSDKLFNSISNEESPSGILFISNMNYYNESDILTIRTNDGIYLENISDPGNLGTIIRTAAWFGFKSIILSPDSVDPFNAKVVRASAGGIFKIDLYLNCGLEKLYKAGIANNYDFVGTTLQNGIALNNWNVSDKNIIFFGNEAHGLTNSAKQLLKKKITVSGSGNIESLNLSVTAGIVLNYLFGSKIKGINAEN